jgi:2-polyprenyl-6-methoxyphenol hydroxylase-like FAD-dependent oxidoreductase
MSRIVVLGAGICGLAVGTMLRRDGHDVTVLERDPEPAPGSVEDACERWRRDGVAQFGLPHFLQPRGRMVLGEILPEVLPALEAAGGLRFDLLEELLPAVPGATRREGDERFQTLTARRGALEQALAQVAEGEPGLEVRRGVAVTELVVRAYDGIPHVTGVRTDSGQELRADLVVDAMGRRSRLPRWLTLAGARPIHEEVEDSGFVYYTRYFRGRDGHMPEFRAPPVTPVGTFSLLTIPSDNNTWSIVVAIAAGDAPLKRLRDPNLWTALLAACPRHEHWLDGDPITDLIAMGGVTDRYRRFSPGGQPVATGVVSIGDAWACTNPTNGRGMSLGLMHVKRLRDLVRTHLDDPHEFAEVWDAVTEAELTPWYLENVDEDRVRIREMDALRNGREPAPPSAGRERFRLALQLAAMRDADALRVLLDARCCLTPLRDALANPDLVARILRIAAECERPPLAGPNRAQLLELLNRRSKLRDGRVRLRDHGPDIAPYARCENEGTAA